MKFLRMCLTTLLFRLLYSYDEWVDTSTSANLPLDDQITQMPTQNNEEETKSADTESFQIDDLSSWFGAAWIDEMDTADSYIFDDLSSWIGSAWIDQEDEVTTKQELSDSKVETSPAPNEPAIKEDEYTEKLNDFIENYEVQYGSENAQKFVVDNLLEDKKSEEVKEEDVPREFSSNDETVMSQEETVTLLDDILFFFTCLLLEGCFILAATLVWKKYLKSEEEEIVVPPAKVSVSVQAVLTSPQLLLEEAEQLKQTLRGQKAHINGLRKDINHYNDLIVLTGYDHLRYREDLADAYEKFKSISS